MKSLKSFIITGISLSFIGLLGLGCGGAGTGTGDGTGNDNPVGDTLTFGASEQISDTAIPVSTSLSEFLLGGISNRLAARSGSLHVDSIWTTEKTGDLVALFDQNVDFLGFGADFLIAENPGQNFIPTSIVINNQLNPGVVLAGDSSGSSRLSYLSSGDQGSSFLAPVELDPSDPGDYQYQANAQLDAQDSVHVVYVHQSSALGTGDKIRYVRSDDHGATWNAPKQISVAASTQIFPQIAVSDDGQSIYICYSDDPDGFTSNILLVKSTDGGNSFGNPTPVSASGTAGFCRIALGPENQVYISYMEETTGDVKFAQSQNNGDNFSPALQINTDAVNTMSSLPMMAVDSFGRIDIVWSADPDNDGTMDALMYARSIDGGGSFSANLPIDDGTGEVIVAPLGLTHDLSGRLHVQYLSDKNNPAATYDIFYQRAE